MNFPMVLPNLSAVTGVRDRAAVLAELRRLLPGLEDSRTALPFGLDDLDSFLPDGGLAYGALHEIVPETSRATPAALGFIVAILVRISFPPPERGKSMAPGHRVGVNSADLTPPRCALRIAPLLSGEGKGKSVRPIVFILPGYGLRQYGRPYGHGLRALGLDPASLILVETAHRKQSLWAMEEALRSHAPAAVAGVIDKLDLKTSQRLQLAAGDAGLPLLLLRPAQNLEASAAATRWRIGTAEAARDRFGLFARPRWRLRLERCRNGRPGEWVVEYDHVAHRFSLAAALADPALPRRANENSETSERRERFLRQAR